MDYRIMCQRLVTSVFFMALLFAMSVAAEEEPTFVVTVHDLGHFTTEKEGAKIVVRGYLGQFMHLYATEDQAHLRDYSGIVVADPDGRINYECIKSYVEIVARIVYLPGRQLGLSPLSVTTLDIDGDSNLETKLCWSKND